jgi:DNA-3-methyladenine glycosylase II
MFFPLWACGAAGSALPWHGRGHRFDPGQVHQSNQTFSATGFRGAILDKAMTCDSHLFQLWAQYPGLRVGRAWSGFETMFTTVLGQLVSVSFGRILIDELMRAAGSKAHHPKTREDIYLFPTAQQIIDADLSRVRTSEGRRTTIRAMATLVENGSLNWGKAGSTGQLRATLLAIPGVGNWTAEYIAMRAFHDNDAFPATDYGLKQVLKQHPEIQVKRVRPWRAYAASALWRSFAETKGIRNLHKLPRD